jgi:hypothetical protein
VADLPDVRVGQVWADNDRRSSGRYVRIAGWTDYSNGKPLRALVALCTAEGQVIRINGKGKASRIRIDRFRPTTTGYRLVHDAPT